jgi:hypothetical protein
MNKDLKKFIEGLKYSDFRDENGKIKDNKTLDLYYDLVDINKKNKNQIEDHIIHMVGVYFCPLSLTFSYKVEENKEISYLLTVPHPVSEIISSDFNYVAAEQFKMAVEEYDYLEELKNTYIEKVRDF